MITNFKVSWAYDSYKPKRDTGQEDENWKNFFRLVTFDSMLEGTICYFLHEGTQKKRKTEDVILEQMI